MTKSRHVPRDVWAANIRKGLAARPEEKKKEHYKKVSEHHKGRSWGKHTEEWKREMSRRNTGIKRGNYNRVSGATDTQKELAALRAEYAKYRMPEMPHNPKLNIDEMKRLIDHIKKLPR